MTIAPIHAPRKAVPERTARVIHDQTPKHRQSPSPGLPGDGGLGAVALRSRHFGADAADSWAWLRLILMSFARFFTQVL